MKHTTTKQAGLTLKRWNVKPWKQSDYRGRRILQTPVDLWLLSEWIDRAAPSLIVELGVNDGGFTLWLHDQANTIRQLGTTIVGIDRKLPEASPGLDSVMIELVEADTLSAKAFDAVAREIQHIDDDSELVSDTPRLFILDDDHSPKHVVGELEKWSQLCRPGDWLLVCDTIRVVGLEMAVRAWTDGSDFERAGADRFGLSNNRSGWLRRKGARR